jgi:hypothetical protein
MVLVSESPGEDHGAIGVVTLEDVIEELIGEEIVDETDVFVDVSRHVKRMNPAAAFAHHHSFHRISSRLGRHPSQSEIGGATGPTKGQSGGLNTNVTGAMKPLNKATEPKPSHSTRITIKSGVEARNAQHAATVVSQEERLMGKKAARKENYGTMGGSNIATPETDDGGNVLRPRSSVTLIEERVNISGNGDNGKVVISPVKYPSDVEDEGSPLL